MCKIFFGLIIGIIIPELFLIFWPNWQEKWDETDKDRYTVLAFIIVKCISKITLLVLIILFSIKSMKLVSSVNDFNKSLGTNTCGDDYSN